jgi:hypothetical protein
LKNARVLDLVYLTGGIPLVDAVLYLCRMCEFRKPGPTDRLENPTRRQSMYFL